MKKFITAITALILGFAIGVVAGQFIEIGIGNEKETINVQILQEQLKEVSELVTLEDTIPVICTVESNLVKSNNNVIKFFTAKEVTATSKVVVKMGTDLESAEFDINEEGTELKLTVPHSTINSASILEDEWQVESKSGVFNWVKIEDNDTLRKTVKDQAETYVADKELLSKADENVSKHLKTILETANPGLTVTVEFK